MADDSQCKSCDSATCSARERREGETDEQFADRQALAERLCRIRHKVLVLSGKGGVGKSTVAANVAVSLARRGRRVGLLDVDIHGPSIPKLLHLEGQLLQGDGTHLQPVAYNDHLGVISIGFVLQSPDEAVIWRGPLKMGAIRQFLRDVEWGDLDYLVVDSPPGTGDEPLSVCQLIGDADGAIVVTTPQDVAVVDVRKCISFCRQLHLPVLGVVENMSGFVCPHCGESTDLFKAGGGEQMAADLAVPFLGRVPIDPQVVIAGDAGTPLAAGACGGRISGSPAAAAFEHVIDGLVAAIEHSPADPRPTPGQARGPAPPTRKAQERAMKIAIPTVDGRLCPHFGHCQSFAIVTVNDGTIEGTQMLEPPPHEPGVLPRWLSEQGANVIIAGGMGNRAQALFQQFDIEVVVGAPPEEPETVVQAWLDGTLEAGTNLCDH
ncbi:P-loop NTPase [bacterium]|nr:P-loop NTPase [bacterium]